MLIHVGVGVLVHVRLRVLDELRYVWDIEYYSRMNVD